MFEPHIVNPDSFEFKGVDVIFELGACEPPTIKSPCIHVRVSGVPKQLLPLVHVSPLTVKLPSKHASLATFKVSHIFTTPKVLVHSASD